MVPPVVVSTPVIRLKVVLLPAPLGPIRATISRAWTSKETSLTAITPPNCLRAFSICSSVGGRGRRAHARGKGQRRVGQLAGRLERQPRHQPGPDAGRRQLQQHDQQDAEHDGLELALAAKDIRQIALQHLLQDHDDAGAEHRAPDIAGAADHGDEQIFDAGLRAERRRVGGALEMRIEPAGQAGQHRRIDEHQKLGARRLHAERFAGDMPAPQRADRAAGAGVQQVHGQQRRDQHRDPDREIDRAGIEHPEIADRERRDAGDAVIAAEEFQLAEQIKQPDAPGDGAERQIMAGQPHRDDAEQDGGDAADQQRERQRQPRRKAVGGRQHRRGIGAEAAKGRLAERGEAADAGQQHQPHRHQGGEADIVEQHDPERRDARDERDRRHDEREDEDRKPLMHRRQSFSSSTAGAASERSTSTGRISVKTMTSLKLLA